MFFGGRGAKPLSLSPQGLRLHDNPALLHAATVAAKEPGGSVRAGVGQIKKKTNKKKKTPTIRQL
jgi:hypothetical protein